jgi:hypothetical protein
LLQRLERELGGDALASYRGLWGLAHGLATLVLEGVPIPFDESLRVHVRAMQALAATK